MFLKLIPRFSWRDLLFSSLGFIAGVLACNWTYFELDSKIQISELISAIVGAYIGLYIASKLSSRISSDRIEKDLLIDHIKNIRIDLLKLNAFIDGRNIIGESIIRLIKDLSQNIAQFSQMLDFCNYSPDIKAKTVDILAKVRNINSQITSLTPSINGIIMLPVSIIPDLLSKIKKSHSVLTQIIFEINRIER